MPAKRKASSKDQSTATIGFEAIHANDERSRTLATLRDTLLPKLLSGELSVEQTNERLSAR